MLKVRTDLDVEFLAFELYELEVTEPREDFELEIARATQAVRAGTFGDIGRARALYRRFGTDPTRTRPSNEALLRRLKKGDALPRGDELTIRLGAEGEGYSGIGKQHVNVGGRLCVADSVGPCGNPSADSARTMITTETERAAWIYFLPVTDDDIDRTAELVAVFGRGLVRMA